MPLSRPIPDVERPDFFDGQLLEAGDLTAFQAFHRELRWLHNRAFHGWGVVSGLVVTGKKGDRAVRASPGLALDCLGRDLVLPEEATGAVPPVAGAPGTPAQYALAISYARDAELPAETRTSMCGASGAVRRPERARLRWLRPNEVRQGEDVVLALVSIANCQLATDVTEGAREDVGGGLPLVAAGQTPASATPWRHWPATNPAGVETTVSTTAGGFSRTPVYAASVVGARDTGGGASRFLVDGHVVVDDATATSFRVRVLLPGPLQIGSIPLNPAAVRASDFPDRLQTELGWHVVWIGVEAAG